MLFTVKGLNKKHADKAKERRKEMAANAETRAKAILEEEAQPFLVEVLDVGANPKVSLPVEYPLVSASLRLDC